MPGALPPLPETKPMTHFSRRQFGLGALVLAALAATQTAGPAAILAAARVE